MVNVTIVTAGTSGPRGNGWLSGTGAPSNSIGFNGDFYLDLSNTSVFYGPKADGAWPAPTQFTAQKSNLSANRAPLATDDQTQGYVIGSLWDYVTVIPHLLFIANSVDTNAAVWVPILPVGTVANTVAAGNDPRIANAVQTTTVLGGDLSGTLPDPTVTTTHLVSPLPLVQGGTGSATQNFVDLTNTQIIGGVKTFTGEVNVPTPLNADDAVTKAYADGIASGVSFKQSVETATAGSPLPSNTYNNGTAGVGATLTATAPGVLVPDGYIPSLNDRILVKDESNATHNGLYNLTTVGTSAVPYILTRTTDADTPPEVTGAAVFVNNGTINKGSGWIVFGFTNVDTIGVTPINWTQYSSPGVINAGTGLNLTGNTLSLITPVAQINLPAGNTTQTGIVEIDGAATDIQPLGVQAAGSTGKVADAGHVHPTTGIVLQTSAANSVVPETSYNQGSSVGTSLGYARADHTHGSPSISDTTPATTEAIGTVGSAGISGSASRSDHVHPMASAGSPTTSAVGDTQSTGTATTFSASDHRHARESFGSVVTELTYGQSASDGTSTNVAHSDHTHGSPPLTSAPPPTTQAIGTIAATGVASVPARSDHVHPMASAGTPTTSAVGDTAAIGNAVTFSASNHVHGRESFGAVTALSAFNTSSSSGTATTVSHSDHVHGAPALPVASTGSEGIVQLSGDLGGTATAPSVLKINGVAVSGTPSSGNLIAATSPTTATWQNATLAAGYSSTGLIGGAVMTFNSSTSFNISAGLGIISDAVTNPFAPTTSLVNIPSQTVNLGAAEQGRPLSWWMMNANGTIFSLSGAPTPNQRRQNIQLGSTAFLNGTLTVVLSNPVYVPQDANQRYDIGVGLGVFQSNVAKISPSGANLRFNLAAGTLFSIGTNYAVDPRSPDFVTTVAENPASFFYATRTSGSQVSATLVDPTHYDVGGVVTLIPGGGATATLQRVFLFGTRNPGAQIAIQYGASTYTSLANAIAGVGTDVNFTTNPDFTQGAFVAWIAITKQCTSLVDTNNCSIIPAGRFANP